MAKFPFDWKLQLTNTYHRTKNWRISNLKINSQWNLVCLWSNQYCRPDFLEICRNSRAGDILVSGTFKLMHGKTCILQRKFIQLIEDGFATTQVELEYTKDNYNIATQSYSIAGTLTIPADVAYEANTKGVKFESLLVLSSDFERLLDPKATYFSDVNMRCGTVSFSVHKNILAVRSPVFAAMFTTEMKENRENKVEISDLSPDVLKAMLFYIYTGKTGALSPQSAGELLFAGDKYQLQDLKKVCSDYLKSCVSVENVLNILIRGYLNDKELKDFAIDFICNSCEEFEVLEKTMEWWNFLAKIPSLAMEVLTRLVKSKDEKLKSQK